VSAPPAHKLPRERLGALLERLGEAGYRCVGPQLRDGAIVYDTLSGVGDLPRGTRDLQAPGHYRLRAAGDQRCFAWAVGPQALKPLSFAAEQVLWRADRRPDGGIVFREQAPPADRVAVLGVRACDLAALALQDQHFLEGRYRDPYYAARRAALFLIAVNCGHPADTCFCACTGDGPHARAGYDIALTELDDGFIARAGSGAGRAVLEALALHGAAQEQLRAERDQAEQAAAAQTRALPGRDLREPLFAHLQHPGWDDVAARCAACGNCTSVCPTCFCHSAHDEPEPGGAGTEHVRRWDSCFTEGHSLMHGHPLRGDIRARYRQWLTHKLGSWHDQYGRSGCVGCGRCITWCPVGIDITAEARVLCTPP